MIPIRDTIQSRSYPVVNITLIMVNFVAFFVQVSHGQDMDRFLFTYGLVPARYSLSYISIHFSLGQQLFSLISFMFLHGGAIHILGNMWSLYIFGDNVEDHLGSFYYFIFYLICGLLSGVCHLLFNLHSTIPTIGASGAIAGVMGAYFILFPNAKILTLIPIIIFPWFIEIPAFFFLGIWFMMQIFNAALGDSFISGIAWWAHVGGFILGVLGLKTFNYLMATGHLGALKQACVKKKKTSRFQVLKPSGQSQNYHLYEIICVTKYEASAGAKKMVNISYGFYSRFYNIIIPAGTREGTILRLKALGKQRPDDSRGDLFLKVWIQEE